MGGCVSSASGKAPAKQEAKEETKVEEPATATIAEVTPEERALLQLKLIFDSIDNNADGTVDKGELNAALKKDPTLGALMKDAGFNNLDALEQLDTNHDGRVTWEEFQCNLKKAAVTEVKGTGNLAAAELPADQKALKQLRNIYDGLDTDNDGSVSKDELGKGLEKEDGLSQLIKEAGFNTEYYVLEQLDTNKDGRIGWDEFEAHLKKAAKEEVKDHGEVVAAVQIEETKAEDAVQPRGWFSCC